MYQLKKQIQAERVMSVKEKIEQNRKKLEGYISEISSVISTEVELNGSSSLLNSRIQHPPCKFSGFSKGFGDKDYSNNEEELLSSSIELPKAHKIDPYTTWIWLDRSDSRPFISSFVFCLFRINVNMLLCFSYLKFVFHSTEIREWLRTNL